jgi:hypothetical protein
MAFIKKGNALTTALKTGGTTFTKDRYGKTTATSTYYLDQSVEGTFLATPPAAPISGVGFESMSLQRESLEVTKATVVYIGAVFPIGTTAIYTYEVGVSASTEPIETHPKFFEWAGYPDPNEDAKKRHLGMQYKDGTGGQFWGIWINGDEGSKIEGARFVGWTSDDTNGAYGKSLFGTTSYLQPATTWTETIVTKVKPTGLNQSVGFIDPVANVPGANKPVLEASASWLLESFSQTSQGSGEAWTTRRTWRMSGRKGWNTYIYTKP